MFRCAVGVNQILLHPSMLPEHLIVRHLQMNQVRRAHQLRPQLCDSQPHVARGHEQAGNRYTNAILGRWSFRF